MFNNETTAFVSIMAQNERADRERKLRKNRVLAAGAGSIRPKLDRAPSHQLELKLGEHLQGEHIVGVVESPDHSFPPMIDVTSSPSSEVYPQRMQEINSLPIDSSTAEEPDTCSSSRRLLHETGGLSKKRGDGSRRNHCSSPRRQKSLSSSNRNVKALDEGSVSTVSTASGKRPNKDSGREGRSSQLHRKNSSSSLSSMGSNDSSVDRSFLQRSMSYDLQRSVSYDQRGTRQGRKGSVMGPDNVSLAPTESSSRSSSPFFGVSVPAEIVSNDTFGFGADPASQEPQHDADNAADGWSSDRPAFVRTQHETRSRHAEKNKKSHGRNSSVGSGSSRSSVGSRRKDKRYDHEVRDDASSTKSGEDRRTTRRERRRRKDDIRRADIEGELRMVDERKRPIEEQQSRPLLLDLLKLNNVDQFRRDAQGDGHVYQSPRSHVDNDKDCACFFSKVAHVLRSLLSELGVNKGDVSRSTPIRYKNRYCEQDQQLHIPGVVVSGSGHQSLVGLGHAIEPIQRGRILSSDDTADRRRTSSFHKITPSNYSGQLQSPSMLRNGEWLVSRGMVPAQGTTQSGDISAAVSIAYAGGTTSPPHMSQSSTMNTHAYRIRNQEVPDTADARQEFYRSASYSSASSHSTTSGPLMGEFVVIGQET